MDERVPSPSRRRSSGLRDLAKILAAVTVVFGVGTAAHLFDGIEVGLRGSPYLDELTILTSLTTAGIAVFALRRWRQAEHEHALRREAEARFREIVERVPAVVYVWDGADAPGSAPAAYISPQIESLLGFRPDEWLARPETWAERLHPDDLPRVLRAWDAAVAAVDSFSEEYRIRRADGTWVWIRDDAAPVRAGARGAPIYQGVLIDVTEQVTAREQLLAAEERYRSLVEHLPVVVYTDAVDEQSTALYISPGYEALTGYTPQQRLHNPHLWVDMLHPDDRDWVLAESERTNRTGEPFDVEYRIVTADGRTVWLADQAVLVPQPGGRAVWQGVLTDITARRRAELALDEAERRYRSLIETIPAVTYIDAVDDSMTTLYVSPQITDALGFTPEEWIEDHELWRRRVHPEDAERVREAVRAHNRGAPYDIEYRFRHRDGRWLWLRDQAVVIRDEAGVPLFSQGVIFDVTEQKAAEAHLREAEERFRGIVEHVPAGIYLDRADGSLRTIYANPKIEDITGITPQEWIDDPSAWANAIDAEDRDAVVAGYLDAIGNGRPWSAEYRMRTRDGRTIWVHDETVFLHDDEGRPSFIQGVLFDVTERKLAEEALRESERRERDAAERLRALDDMKNTFLAAVSHELRSPLTSILGLALTLQRAPDLEGPERGDLLGRLASNAIKLDRLLKDLLDIDRLQRGIVEPQYRATDVAALARRVVAQLEVLDDRSLAVNAEPVVMPVDPAKVERIVENLLTNAARHTATDRRIWLDVHPHDGGVLIVVEDDGPGVAPELRAEIFEPFRQGPTASPHAPGTGVGLSLVARFAELHGGRAWVEDRPGGGASFRVFLPAPGPLPSAGTPTRGDAVRAVEPLEAG